MRKIVLYTLMSLDGAVDDPDRFFIQPGERTAVPEFDEAMVENEERVIAAQDTVLLGRGMYDQWARFWPTADDQPFTRFINSVQKYVITSSPLSTAWHNAEAVHEPVVQFVQGLKARPGGDIGIHGSIELAQSLLAAGLVDELQLVVGPTVGFSGRRLFTGDDQVRRLDLVRARPTPSGAVLLTYSVGREGA
ncbi:dihydrofolate reductase family protein [Phycicoccus sp. Soil748]|uniref:dihydrofolate reductase family protein n=1 Tax=Phycicoccus sp. Soil748 TaxID=1736397 RepID=UPI0007032DB0|nr:dihydrofolate reductase family protein [Phycicoccus sp. Soil748]KRE52607.1 deaminase [Phycicoccus sp. Soil748]